MSKYVIHDAAGNILRTIDCQPEHVAAQLQQGEQLFEGEAEPHDRIDVEESTVIRRTAPATTPIISRPEPLPYVTARKKAYPSIQSQLDTFWHAMDAGDFPRLEPWFSQIKAVKDTFPKTVGDAQSQGQITETL